MAEDFKDIPGYEGLYQVSTLGKVKALQIFYSSGVDNRSIKERHEGIMCTTINRGGYERVSLTNDKIRKSFLVHRLVALTFLKKPNDLDFVNHKNGVKIDNKIKNLEWCNRSQNIRHAITIGLKPPITGADNKLSKKVYQIDELGNVIKEYPSRRIAVKESGVCESSMYHVLAGNWKQVRGLYFSYNN